MEDQTEREVPLRAPLIDGNEIGTVAYAEIMDFTLEGRLLVYDAFNVIPLASGQDLGLWSVYALDLANDRILTVVEPLPGLQIGNPALGQTRDQLLTLDVSDQQSAVVVAIDLQTADLAAVGNATGGIGVPSYAGDDRAIVYTQADYETVIGTSLVRQPMAADGIHPSGSPNVWLRGAAAGVIYRRGDFTPPAPVATPTRVPTAPIARTPTQPPSTPTLTRTPTPRRSTATPTRTSTRRPTPTPALCVGDCDGNKTVAVNELVQGLNIALGSLPWEQCPSFDSDESGGVTINELLQAVNGALYGCL